jgi:UDP-N-acetylglucosamine acyltransferase
MPIHPTAVIDRRAEIDATVEVGPFVVVDGPVRVGARTHIGAHAVLLGSTSIGEDNVIHAGAVIGDEPQDLSYRGQPAHVRIGNRNVFRESCEVHRGSKEDGTTVIGDDNFLMTRSHVAHDCRLGNHVIVATGAAIGGHVLVDDQAFISGNCVVHQFVRVGRLALLRGLSRPVRDVPPFCLFDGTRTVRGLNRVGLRRAGFTLEQIGALQRAFVRLFRRPTNLRQAVADVEKEPCSAEVQSLLEFIRASKRGVATGPRPSRGDGDG